MLRRTALFVATGLALVAGCTSSHGPDRGPGSDPIMGHGGDGGPDADPSCHWDCFGYHECHGGVVTTWVHAPVPCAEWTGSCPRYESAVCPMGCAVESEPNPFADPMELCATHPPDAGPPADAAPTPCGESTCSPSEVCVLRHGGADAGPDGPRPAPRCEPRPSGCTLSPCDASTCCTISPCVQEICPLGTAYTCESTSTWSCGTVRPDGLVECCGA